MFSCNQGDSEVHLEHGRRMGVCPAVLIKKIDISNTFHTCLFFNNSFCFSCVFVFLAMVLVIAISVCSRNPRLPLQQLY